MNRWVGRVALVTGASAGIGAAVCRKLVEQGLIVVGCARSVEKIQKVSSLLQSVSIAHWHPNKLSDDLKDAKGKLHARQCDLTKEDEIMALFGWIKANLGGVDVCVNNAGLGDDASLLGPGNTSIEKPMPSKSCFSDLRIICCKLEKYARRQCDCPLLVH